MVRVRRARRFRQAFIEQHLADAGLTPAVIAEAHHVSLRHLQRLVGNGGHGRVLVVEVQLGEVALDRVG